jgi:RsiW-degrading membrane proteinase PrsW (M82 family)
MRPIAYMMAGVAPLIAIVIFIYFKNRNQGSYSRLLLRSFIAGSAGVLVLVAAEYLGMILGINNLRSLNRTLFYSFLTIGLSSELGKFIVFRYYVNPKEQISKPIDAITFSIMTSLGFSTLALILFIFNAFEIQTHFPVTLYTFVYVPASIMFAVIMGFFVGMAKFLKTRIVFSMTGLFGAAFFHGIFNFCMLTNDFKLLSLFSFGSTLIVLVLGMKAAFSKPEPLT